MLQRLTQHIYCYPCEYYSDRPNIGYIAGDRAALLFEAGASADHAQAIRKDLNNAGLCMPAYIAVSHWHWDHTFGLHAWDGISVAGKMTNDHLRQVARWKWTQEAMENRVCTGEDIQFCHDMILREYPNLQDITVCPAQVEFTDTLTIDLGGVTCQLRHVAGPHGEDSVVCWIPEDEFLFLGDSHGKDLYGLPWKFDIAHEEDLVPTLESLPYDPEKLCPYRAILEEIPFTSCIGGHDAVMTKEELMNDLKGDVMP